MPLKVIKADIFNPPEPYPSIGHSVNRFGVFGSGIAVSFRRKWPEMYKAYREACLNGELTPGSFFHYYSPSPPLHIYNMAGQDHPGPNAEAHLIKTSMQAVVADLELREIPSILIPKMGCGVGGLSWDHVPEKLTKFDPILKARLSVKDVLGQVADTTDVEIVVAEYEG